MMEELLSTAKLHMERAEFSCNQLQKSKIDLKIFEDAEKIKTIDAFIFRFVKLQDFMGDKLFKKLLDLLGEYKDNMSLIDVLDRLEKLELIPSSEAWIEYRQIRNKLTYEYPDNEEEVVEGVKLALKSFSEIKKILQNIESYVKKHKQLFK